MKKLADTFSLEHQNCHGPNANAECRSYRLTQGTDDLLHIEICGDEVNSIWGHPQKIDKSRLSVDDALTAEFLLIAQKTLVILELSSLKQVQQAGQRTEFRKLSYTRADNEHDVNGLDTRLEMLISLLRSFQSQRTNAIGLHCSHGKRNYKNETA